MTKWMDRNNHLWAQHQMARKRYARAKRILDECVRERCLRKGYTPELKKRVTRAERTYKEAKRVVRELEAQVNQVKRADPSVTDHAVLRYIDRVHGVKIEEIRRTILTDSLRYAIFENGSGRFPVCDGFDAIVRDGSVLTIIPTEYQSMGELHRAGEVAS